MAFELPHLPMIGLTDEQMQIYWQKLVEAIEAQENSQNDIIATLNDTVADLAAAIANISTVTMNQKIATSWTVPENLITATDAGTDATISVASHARLYGDGTKVDPVAAHTFTGQAYNTTYGIYYDDPTTADATPTYQITTTLARAQNNFATGRHRVGEVTTPVAAGAPSYGGTVPAGSGYSVGSSGRYSSY